MKTTHTSGQLQNFLTLLDQKEMTPKRFQEILVSGVLADICDPDADLSDRSSWRNAFKLSLLEPELNYVVSVDRSVRPPYPDWARVVMHSELEGTGPAEYNLRTDVGLWLHPNQENGVTSGTVIYASLKKDNALVDQLGLADLLAIQKKGIAVFRSLFKDKAVFGWKSVVQHRDGNLHVPYLCEFGEEVVLDWDWLDDGWFSHYPAARFSK